MSSRQNHARRIEQKEDEDGCCGLFFLKYVLFIFNTLFWFAGMAVLGIGIWTLIDKQHYISLLSTSTYVMTTYLLIGTGSITIFIGILGCCGALRENRCCLMTYAFMLLLVFLLEAIIGVLAYIYQAGLKEEFQKNLNSTMLQNYMYDEVKTTAINDLQQKFKCCGAQDFEDWKYSKWLQNTKTNLTVPDSCCKTMAPYCGVRNHPSNIYYDSCSLQLEMYMKEHLIIIGAVGLGLCCLQIFGIIFACCMACMVKSYRVSKQPK